MSKIIRGQFNLTPLGRQLQFFANVIDRSIDRGDLQNALQAACAGASLTSDPQWQAVASTLRIAISQR